MAKAKMQKMRKMQKTQKMKKLRKMQKTRKMKGGGLFDGLDGLTTSVSSMASSAYEKGKGAASKLKEESSAKLSKLGKQGLDVGQSVASGVKSAVSDFRNKALERGSAMFEETKNKAAKKIIDKLEPALEKGKDRLGKFLVSMGLKEDESNKAIEAISEGNMEALQENEGLQTLAEQVKDHPEAFAKKAVEAEEKLPEAQTVEVAEVVAEVAEVVEDAEAEVVEDAEDAEAEVVEKVMSGGDITTMVGDTIEDVFTLLMCIVMYGPFKGIEINNRMAEFMRTKRAFRNREKRDAEREEGDELAGGKRKKNKPVKSRKNRKSKKSKSAKKH